MIKLFRSLVIVLALLALMGLRQAQTYSGGLQPTGFAYTHRHIDHNANGEGSEFVWVNDPVVEPTGLSAHVRGMVDIPGPYTTLVESGWTKNLTRPELPERPVPFYNIVGEFGGPWRRECVGPCPLDVGNEYHFAVTLEWLSGDPYWFIWFNYDWWAAIGVNNSTGVGWLPWVWAGIETRDPVDPDIHIAGPMTTKTNVYRDSQTGQWHIWGRNGNTEQFSDDTRYCIYSWPGSDANLLLLGGRGTYCWPE